MFAGAFQGRSVWLSGHTGFKGAWLSEWLLGLGARVHGYSLPPDTQPALFEQLGLAGRLQHEVGDVRDAAAVRRSLLAAEPDFVFHLAAQPLVRTSYEDPVGTYAANVMGTVHVLEALRALPKACAAVFVTTDKCYENREWFQGYREDDPLGGHDPYSSSKAAAEIAIAAFRRSFFRENTVRIASARAGNVIGGGDWARDRIVPDCIRSLQAGAPISVRNKHATRPWQHVLEPLSGYLWLAARLASAQRLPECGTRNAEGGTLDPVSGVRPSNSVFPPRSDLRPPTSDLRPLTSAFNFGPASEANRTVAELVEEILKHWPGRWEDRSDPRAVHEAGRLQLAIDKARALLGWAPVWDFQTAIARTVHWYRESGAPSAVTAAQIAEYAASARASGLPWAVA